MVPIQLLSFDHYPVLGDSLRANWYENLAIISEAARKAENHSGLSHSQLPLKTQDTGSVVSVLKNGANSYLVVVNRDFRNHMKLSIECDAKVKKVLKDGSVVPANVYPNSTEIDPGDIEIYICGKTDKEFINKIMIL